MRFLIVDDERPARDKLALLLARHCGTDEVDQARNGAEALVRIAEVRPDVVFLDVQMPEVNGIEVAASLPDPAPLVVFVTAYDKFALQAFDANAVDYLLKPFDEARFVRTLERLRERLGKNDVNAGLPPDAVPVDRLLISDRGAVKIVPVADILWLETADNYVLVHATDGCHIMRQTLSGLLPRLGSRFVRCHRRAAVRVEAIVRIEALDKGDCRLMLASGEAVPCSRQHRADVMAHLETR